MRLLQLSFIILASAMICGCLNFGYVSYRPNEDIRYSQLITENPKSGWLWIRGKASGDIDGDRKEEEVVIATIQTGTAKNPGPISKLILMIVETDKLQRKLLTHKQEVYLASNSLADTVFPKNVALTRSKGIMTKCSVKVADTDISGNGVIALTLWGEEKNGGGLFSQHMAFSYKNKKLKTVLKTAGTHVIPEISSGDLDRDGKEELMIHHNLLPFAPQSPELKTPEWLSAYVIQKDGTYVQDDSVGTDMYETLLPTWNNNYILALHNKTDKSSLAMYETYIGLLHYHAKRFETAKHFLKLAIKNNAPKQYLNIAQNTLIAIDTRSKEGKRIKPKVKKPATIPEPELIR